jgi:hypothetical protein
VVLVLGVQDEYSHSFPVTVAGTSVTNGSQSPSNPVTVSARVEGGSTFASLLGASADRTLLVTVHNAGRDTVQSLITARWGKSSAPDGVITSPNFITVSAGQTKRVSIPFKLSPLSYGTYHVVGELSGLPATDTFTATTTTWPWGLPVVLLLIVVAIVLFAWYRRRVRARERIAVDSFGPGQAAPGLAALAAMSSVLADDDGGALRLEQVLLLGDIDGEATAVPVAELTLDSRGVGVTNPSTNELRILTWASIRGVHVLDRLDVEDAPDFISSLGSVIDIETTHSTYRFVAPDVSPKDLTQQVDRVVRLWIRPPVRVPSLATGN